MKNLLTSILVLTFSVSTFTQTNETSTCPAISMIGPSGLTRSGETVTFTAEVSKEANKFNPKYNWTVTGGEIVEGQGTLVIKVLQKDSKDSFSATIEVIGLPKACPNTYTTTPVIEPAIADIFPYDEYGKMPFAEEKQRLLGIVIQLKEQPSNVALFIIKFNKKESYSSIKTRIKNISKFLNESHKIPNGRFKFVFSESDIQSNVIYVLPPDSIAAFSDGEENLEKLKPQKQTPKNSSKKAKQ